MAPHTVGKEKVTPLTRMLNKLTNFWQAAHWPILGGFIGAILLLVLFAMLTEDVFSQELVSFDNNIELWVHAQTNSGFDIFFNFFTTIGGIAGISILTAITFGLLWFSGKLNFAWILAVAVGGGILLNQLLKFLFRRPRPHLWAISDNALTTFSFPSAHATVSFCYFGVLAWIGWQTFRPFLIRLVLIAIMFLIVGLVGLSRIYFGVHFPTDVIAGYLSGGLLLVIIFNSAAARQRFRRYKDSKNNDSKNTINAERV